MNIPHDKKTLGVFPSSQSYVDISRRFGGVVRRDAPLYPHMISEISDKPANAIADANESDTSKDQDSSEACK